MTRVVESSTHARAPLPPPLPPPPPPPRARGSRGPRRGVGVETREEEGAREGGQGHTREARHVASCCETDGWRGRWKDVQTDRRRTDRKMAPSSLPCTASAAAVAAAEVHARRTCGGEEWFQRVRKQSLGGGWKLSSEKFERTDAKRGGAEARPAEALHEGVARSSRRVPSAQNAPRGLEFTRFSSRTGGRPTHTGCTTII